MWALVGVVVGMAGAQAVPVSIHATMEQCFTAREVFMEELPKPKMNYEVVCIRTDLNGEET
jgi:hypothetical protein